MINSEYKTGKYTYVDWLQMEQKIEPRHSVGVDLHSTYIVLVFNNNKFTKLYQATELSYSL